MPRYAIKIEYDGKELNVEHVHKGYFAKKGDEYLERESSIADNPGILLRCFCDQS